MPSTYGCLNGFAVSVLFLIAIPGYCTDVPSNTANRTSFVGGGYQSEKQLMAGRCVEGTQTPTGAQKSTFNFSQSLSQREADTQLGLSAGGRARFGAAELTAEAKFMRNTVS